jgi:hypothetical protein
VRTGWTIWAAPLALAVSYASFAWLAAPAASQEPSPLSPRLRQALVRAAPGERVEVLIEVTPQTVPLPLSVERDRRAAEHASNLAGLYRSSVDRLRDGLPGDIGLDLQTGEVLWVGGAVAARLTADQIEALAGRPSVVRVHYDGLIAVDLRAGPEPRARLRWAPGLPPPAPSQSRLPWGLEAIGAPTLWAAGATGEGIVVATLDSGVDADHPLLSRKWRGLSTSPELGWFDPWGLTDVPYDDNGLGGVGHGTTVMTVVLGSLQPGDSVVEGGETRVVEGEFDFVTGVAPGAEWVAVNGFEGFGGSSYTRLSVLLQGMQWVLDPDGDPATVTDVPDVLNNSWGIRSGGCDGVFHRAIDALELAGVPVVFAAGNRSAGLDTVAEPADRADLLLNAFAVGAVELRDGEIQVSPNSLGGPPPCAPAAVKPEVVAPGETPYVRAISDHKVENRGNSTAFTSWAAPHAAGALAVLKGLNPAASAGGLKQALFSTAEDLPPTGLDNRSGAGLIDLVAAANAIGGLGGVRLAVERADWDSTSHALDLHLVNRGSRTFPGGRADLTAASSRESLAEARVEPMVPGARQALRFESIRDVGGEQRWTLLVQSDGARLEFPVVLRAASTSTVTLADGEVRLSLDANGRVGRVAGAPGFVFQGVDWLPGASLLFGMGDRVSDAAYVNVLRQPSLKSNPVGSDTDWRRLAVEAEGKSARVSFSDDRALHPLGASVRQDVELVSIGDTAAFVLLAVSVDFAPGSGTPLAGLLLDWDFPGGDLAAWDDIVGGSMMIPADSAGPWMAVTTLPLAPTTHAAVPLGTVEGGRYVAESDGGVLAQPDDFSDEQKARLMALGGIQSADGRASDWAQLVSVGPLQTGDTVVFIIAAGRDRGELELAVDSARVLALEKYAPAPVQAAAGGLDLLPPYPNPFNPEDGETLSLPYLVDRGDETVDALLEIFTIAGRPVYSEQRMLSPDSPVEPFRWAGRLENGDAAATGVYGYVIRVGGRKRSGKFVLIK